MNIIFFMAKGVVQPIKPSSSGTPSLLKEELLLEYLDERIAALELLPVPYHLAIVIEELQRKQT